MPNQKNVCPVCGAEMSFKNGRYVCHYCGHVEEENNFSSEEYDNLMAAKRKIDVSIGLPKFEEAEEDFSNIILKNKKCAAAYWGRMLAHYGVKFEFDYDGSIKPVCYKPIKGSVLDSVDYKKAIEFSNGDEKKKMQEFALEVDQIREDWLKICNDPKEHYDVFLSFKSAKESGDRTAENRAHDIYINLTKNHFSVFFSKESLNKGKSLNLKYEPRIYNALNTASVLIVVSTNADDFNSTWVASEWERFRYRRDVMKEDIALTAAVPLDGVNVDDLPQTFRYQNLFDLYDVNLIGKLSEQISLYKKHVSMISRISGRIAGPKVNVTKTNIEAAPIVAIEKINPVKPASARKRGISDSNSAAQTVYVDVPEDINNNLDCAQKSLDKEVFDEAARFYNKVLDIDPNNAEAKFGLILAKHKCGRITRIKDLYSEFKQKDFENLSEYLAYINNRPSESEKKATVLMTLSEYCADCFPNFNKIKTAFDILKYYANDASVQKLCISLGKKTVNSNSVIYDKDTLGFLSDVLHVVSDNNFQRLIRIFIDAAVNDKKQKLFETVSAIYKEFIGTDEYIIYSELLSKYSCSKLDELVNALIDSNNYDELKSYLSVCNSQTSATCYECILKKFNHELKREDGNYDNAIAIADFMFGYNFINREKFLKQELEVLSEKGPNLNKVYDSLLKRVSTKEQFVAFSEKRANYLFKNAYYEDATHYFDSIIGCGVNLLECYKGKLFCLLKCSKFDVYDSDIEFYPIEDDGGILDELVYLMGKEKFIREILIPCCGLCISEISRSKDRVNKRAFEVFKYLLRYFPEDQNQDFTAMLVKMVNACLKYKHFEECVYFINELLVIEKLPEYYYFAILAKCKASDADDAKKSTVQIKNLPEYQALVNCVDKKDGKIIFEKVLDIIKDREEYLKRKRRARIFGIVLIAIAAAIALVLALVFKH